MTENVDRKTVEDIIYTLNSLQSFDNVYDVDLAAATKTLRALLDERDALKAEVLKLREENERLRGLVFAAYCEGWIEAGGGVLVDNKWAQSECHAALKGNSHDVS